LELNFNGEVENLLEKHIYSLKVENVLKEILQENRKNDLITGQTSFGAHKSKLVCRFLSKKDLAEHASTGEQKMMLISIIVSFTKLIQKIKKISPILLLDEINVHLDKSNIKYVTNKVLELGSQVFITTTHKERYQEFEQDFEFFKIDK
jgi:DNA replication and repair protein RecF